MREFGGKQFVISVEFRIESLPPDFNASAIHKIVLAAVDFQSLPKRRRVQGSLLTSWVHTDAGLALEPMLAFLLY